MSFQVDAKAEGVVRLYGPSVRTRRGEPKFRRAVVREWASHMPNNGPGEVSSFFDFEVEESGTYMVVYGPYYEWESKYSIVATCTEGCRKPGECFADIECNAGEACVDNGVRCISAPCEVNYNVCKPVDPGCTDDSQCGENQWCRATDRTSSSRECVPFVKEGETCGGFTLPQFYNRCEPKLSCVFRPFIADAPGKCRVNVTVAELLRDPAKYRNQRVNVDATINTGYALCTKMACSPSNACCNTCGAAQTLSDTITRAEGITLTDTNGEFRCGGNECNYKDNCSAKDGKWRIVGKFIKGPHNYTIEVESKTSLKSL